MKVGVTGHRPDKLGGYSPALFEDLVLLAKTWLRNVAATTVYSVMALGWDQACAQAAIDCEIPLVAAVPFEGQERMWPMEQRRYYESLLSRAIVKIVSPGGYAPEKMQTRNVWIVDQSDVILALWNEALRGGTANCIAYAKQQKKTILNLYVQFLRGRA